MQITTELQKLTILLDRKEQLAALKSRIVLPRSSIIAVHWCDSFNNWRTWEVRMPGTNAPRFVLAGSFWTEMGWDFVFARHPKGLVKQTLSQVMVIETDLDKYRRVIVQVPKRTYEHVRSWQESA